MNMVVVKWGNSLGIRIPGALAKAIGLREGTEVRLAAKRGRIVIEQVALKNESLAALLAGVTPDNLHDCIETGAPTEREIW